jgi:hypothetical protein
VVYAARLARPSRVSGAVKSHCWILDMDWRIGRQLGLGGWYSSSYLRYDREAAYLDVIHIDIHIDIQLPCSKEPEHVAVYIHIDIQFRK